MKRFLFFGLCFLLLINSAYSKNVYKSKVVASYYAGDFHGKRTSNGEVFNMWSMTCAHKMLPFNTILKVTNLSNGKSVQVRVNDRGPFVGTREIDLSKGAASKIGMIGTGTANVRLEIIQLGKYTKQSVVTAKKACKMAGIEYKQVKLKSEENIAPKEIATVTVSTDNVTNKINVSLENKKYNIQLASFESKQNAQKFGQKVKKAGFENVVLQVSSNFNRVVIKNVCSNDLQDVEQRLIQAGFFDYSIKEVK